MCKELPPRTQTLCIPEVNVLVSGTLTSTVLSDDFPFPEGTYGALSEASPLPLVAGRLLAAKMLLAKLSSDSITSTAGKQNKKV